MGGPTDTPMDEEDSHASTLDVTLPCQSTTISLINALLPCPLVFFPGLNRCKSNVGRGDAELFEFLWQSMENQIMIPFVMSDGEESNTGKVYTRRGYVSLDNKNGDEQSIGFAFMVPGGRRILCIQQVRGGFG